MNPDLPNTKHSTATFRTPTHMPSRKAYATLTSIQPQGHSQFEIQRRDQQTAK